MCKNRGNRLDITFSENTKEHTPHTHTPHPHTHTQNDISIESVISKE